jgi:hypothetical protein
MELAKQHVNIGKEAAELSGDLRTSKNIEDWANFRYSDDTQSEMTTGERKRSEADVMAEYGIKL